MDVLLVQMREDSRPVYAAANALRRPAFHIIGEIAGKLKNNTALRPSMHNIVV
jgi:hypothetical protein